MKTTNIHIPQHLLTRLHASDHLGQLYDTHCLTNIEASDNTAIQQDDLVAIQAQLVQMIAAFNQPDSDQAGDAGLFLRQQKRAFTLLWAIASLSQQFCFEQLGEWWSLFAARSIDFALRAAWRSAEIKPLCRGLNLDISQPVLGLFVLGLGKLGGKDLNFSSDVDLVAFYDADLVPVSPMQGKTDVCTRVLKQMTSLLSQTTSAGFVWRVDWRLRPEASINPLAMPVLSALQFYYYRSLPWHRLAMIKARVVAGDVDCGTTFLADLDRFIWRMNLDFRAIDELASLKQKINLEHPGLKLARTQNHTIDRDTTHFNIKLGRGGIREIEFMVNALQLVWGGRRTALRNPNTLSTLQQLADEQLIDQQTSTQLGSAYALFRQTENAVQMLENRQEYLLPAQQERQSALLSLLNVSSWDELTQSLFRYRTFVANEFDASFAANEPADFSATNPQRLLDMDLDAAACDIVAIWLNGFQLYGVANTEANQLAGLASHLCEELEKTALPLSDAIKQIDVFFQSLPTGVQYFRLLNEHPTLLHAIVRPLLMSPPMASLLQQSPHIVDSLITPELESIQHKPLQRSAFVLACQDVEMRAERLRRFVNEELYLNYLKLLQGKHSSADLHEQLTVLAEHTLELGLQITCEELEIDSVPIAVLGLGKLGMQAMSPLSDLDLIFIAQELEQIESANRFSRRLQHVMETRMREGIAYEMDMRLRPSGRSGPPTVSLASFERYHQQHAQSWEHIALVAGRLVTGNPAIGQQTKMIRQAILSRPRDQQQFTNDAWKMLDRIRAQRTKVVSADSLAIKLRRGGLMEADYLCACIAIQQFQQHPEWSALPYQQLLDNIGAQTEYNKLPGIIAFWRKLQIWTRLLNLEQARIQDFPAQEKEFFYADCKIESDLDLEKQLLEYTETMEAYIQRWMSTINLDDDSKLQQWQETSVIWK